MNFPTTLEERQARREQIREKQLKIAEQAILEIERSMKCSGRGFLYGKPFHAGQPDGCKNDGTSCICECHDPVEVKGTVEDYTLTP